MIENAKGNLLAADVEALVNTVNCVGVMGKGIALQFKQAYPEMARAYERACHRGEVVPGKVQVWETGALRGPKYVINFPTKREWFMKSRYQDIESGLVALVAEVRRRQIQSIALPPLGCGNGGLSWTKVGPMIAAAFAELPQVRAQVYAPLGAPAIGERVIKTRRPQLTRARALFIAAIDRYSILAYQISLLEVQKLAYFLQEAGEPLKLKYIKSHYGPYAENLNKVLETLEGHYIHGYDGERAPEKELSLGERAVEEAGELLRKEPDAERHLERVGCLIEGFETPYGMELLSSAHYVTLHEPHPATSAEHAIELIHAWTERKRSMLKPAHIRLAWEQLRTQGWFGSLHQVPANGADRDRTGNP